MNVKPKKKKQGKAKSGVPNRTYKSTVFIMLFEEKKNLLELYNAVSGKHYTNPELLEINTLENAIYMSMKNDVSFVIDSRLSLYEHQSTYSPNLPLRFLMYISGEYSVMTREKNLYGTRIVKIPPPQFVIFYNGEGKQPERKLLKLSEMYTVSEEEISLELTAVMLNLNHGCNEGLKNTCRALKDYAEYTAKVRAYARELSLEDAVERAITECIREGILREFLEKNRAEVKYMSIFEYDQEKHLRQEREEAWEVGRKAGLEQGRSEGEKLGFKKGSLEGEKIGFEKGSRHMLNTLIQKKFDKGRSPGEIAWELEENEALILQVIQEIEARKEETR